MSTSCVIAIRGTDDHQRADKPNDAEMLRERNSMKRNGNTIPKLPLSQRDSCYYEHTLCQPKLIAAFYRPHIYVS